jgi:hypothetical protein
LPIKKTIKFLWQLGNNCLQISNEKKKSGEFNGKKIFLNILYIQAKKNCNPNIYVVSDFNIVFKEFRN